MLRVCDNRESLQKGIHKAQGIWDDIKCFPHRTVGRFAFTMKHGDGEDIMEKEWDNLIIFDACRYDILKELNKFKNVDYIISKASQSGEFCDSYFTGRKFHDTVYTTANPYGIQTKQGVFHDILTTSERTESGKKATPSNRSQSWAPNQVYDAAVEAYTRYPNKKHIIHFMQPHAPYYGKKASELRDILREKGIEFYAWDENISKSKKNALPHLLSAAKQGYITNEELYDIYVDNLALVIEYALDLIDSFEEGKSIITSDHGEMLGEPTGLFLPNDVGHITNNIGHEKRVYTEELRKVPWITINSESNREIIGGDPDNSQKVQKNKVEDQLKALGYK